MKRHEAPSYTKEFELLHVKNKSRWLRTRGFWKKTYGRRYNFNLRIFRKMEAIYE
jgi:hypothetical protein